MDAELSAMGRDQGHHHRAGAPVLFLDVDGVLSLFGLDPSTESHQEALHWIDGIAHCIPRDSGRRLIRLAEHYELVWATGWESRANEHLPEILGLPFSDLACLTFGGRAVFGSSDWKLDAVAAYAGTRPAAWVDDNLDESCRLWARARQAPTLLVDTSCDVGLTDEHVDRLIEWADEVGWQARGTARSSQAA